MEGMGLPLTIKGHKFERFAFGYVLLLASA